MRTLSFSEPEDLCSHELWKNENKTFAASILNRQASWHKFISPDPSPQHSPRREKTPHENIEKLVIEQITSTA